MSNIWPYLAGIVDGEGTLCLNYRPTYVGKNIGAVCFSQIVIYNTSTTLMRWLISNVGGRFYLRTKTSLSKKPQYAWVPSGKKNREQFLLGILPYLVIKKKQAELLLEFDRLGYGSAEKRKELADRCSALNHLEESVETNTSGNPERGLKIESGLTSDCESGPVVTQVVESQTLPA
jgi:hypothetical protein